MISFDKSFKHSHTFAHFIQRRASVYLRESQTSSAFARGVNCGRSGARTVFVDSEQLIVSSRAVAGLQLNYVSAIPSFARDPHHVLNHPPPTPLASPLRYSTFSFILAFAFFLFPAYIRKCTYIYRPTSLFALLQGGLNTRTHS